jgi:hypothetical protein
MVGEPKPPSQNWLAGYFAGRVGECATAPASSLDPGEWFGGYVEGQKDAVTYDQANEEEPDHG